MILNHGNEYDCLEKEEENVNVLQNSSVKEGDGSCSGDDDDTSGLPREKEQPFALAVTKQIIQACGVNNAAFLSAMGRMQSHVRHEASTATQQTTVDISSNKNIMA